MSKACFKRILIIELHMQTAEPKPGDINKKVFPLYYTSLKFLTFFYGMLY